MKIRISSSVLSLLALSWASVPAYAQDAAKPPVNKAEAGTEISVEEGRAAVKIFRVGFADLSKNLGFPTVISWLYTNDYKFIGFDGKAITRDEVIAGNNGMSIATIEQRKDEAKAEGGKIYDLPEKDRYWKPEQYTVTGNEVTVYTYPVSKSRQPMPNSDGRAKNIDFVQELLKDAVLVSVGGEEGRHPGVADPGGGMPV